MGTQEASPSPHLQVHDLTEIYFPLPFTLTQLDRHIYGRSVCRVYFRVEPVMLKDAVASAPVCVRVCLRVYL